MSKTTKFTFNNVFDIRDSVGKRGVSAAKAHPRQYDEDALAAAHAQGRAEGAQEAYSEIEARTAGAMEAIAGKIQLLLDRQTQMTGRMKQDAAILAEAIAKHLAPALLREKPLAEFEAMVETCFAQLHEEPRIVVKVAPELVEPMREKVDAIASRLNPGNDVSVTGESTLSGFDCRVEWSDGGIERDYQRLEDMISEAVQRFVGQWTDGPVAQGQGKVETEPWHGQ